MADKSGFPMLKLYIYILDSGVCLLPLSYVQFKSIVLYWILKAHGQTKKYLMFHKVEPTSSPLFQKTWDYELLQLVPLLQTLPLGHNTCTISLICPITVSILDKNDDEFERNFNGKDNININLNFKKTLQLCPVMHEVSQYPSAPPIPHVTFSKLGFTQTKNEASLSMSYSKQFGWNCWAVGPKFWQLYEVEFILPLWVTSLVANFSW